MDGGLFSLEDDTPTRRIHRLLADGGDTAPPGNSTLRAMAGCSVLISANTLRPGDLLRVYTAAQKGLNSNFNNTNGIQFALYAGPNGNLTDTPIGSFGVTTTTVQTTAAWSAEWRILSNTTMRKQGAGTGFASMSGAIQQVRPAIDTIPNITGDFKLTLAAAMTGDGSDWCVVQDFRIYVER